MRWTLTPDRCEMRWRKLSLWRGDALVIGIEAKQRSSGHGVTTLYFRAEY
ncbi:hypothetical protein KCP71_16030 [Salmonella enterica subsp. enterica]|nr:hypothetical protein KCP71_16030 [Salmonella enterica subsp. enterica]